MMTKYDPNSMLKAFELVYDRLNELVDSVANTPLTNDYWDIKSKNVHVLYLVDTMLDELDEAIDTLEVMVDDKL